MNRFSNNATQASKNERILYLDYLRVLATFAVILLHVSAQNWHETNVNTYQWQILILETVFPGGVLPHL